MLPLDLTFGESAVLAAIGGAIGIISSLVTLWLTFLKEKRAEARRWEKDLREVGAKYYSATMTLASTRSGDNEQFQATEDQRVVFTALGELKMLAPPEVVKAANALSIASSELRRARGKEQVEAKAVPFANAQEDFVRAVSTALGVRSHTG